MVHSGHTIKWARHTAEELHRVVMGCEMNEQVSLVDPLWLYSQLRLGPVLPILESFCFHPYLDGPMDFDACTALFGDMAPVTPV